MNEPASQYVPKPSAVSTGELIDSQKFQDNVKHSEHYYDYDRNGKLNQVKNDSFGQLANPEDMWEDNLSQIGMDYMNETHDDDAPWLDCMDGLKMTDEELMKKTVGFIDEYDDALKELAKSEKVELRAELEVKKKENFQSVAVACMAEYNRTYGMMPEDELWMFLEAEYYGTGEGQTLCLQMTQASPWGGDNGDFDRTLPYPDDCKPLNTKQYRAVRGFHKLFGTWYLHGLRFHTREAFFTRYANQLPASLLKLKDQRCMLEYHSELHYNFS